MSSYSPAIGLQESPFGANARVSPLVSLLAPSLGAAIFAIALLHVLFLSAGTRTLFRDSDTGWHIRNGEAILSTRSVPRADPYSYTSQGREWFSWEWVADIVLGAAHQLGGPAGVALLAAVVIALTTWGVTSLALSLGANFFSAAVAAGLVLGSTSIHWLARPHIFSWLLALGFLAVAEHKRRSASRSLYWLPLLACVWANVHGSFPLGPGILFLYAVGEFLSALHARGVSRFVADYLRNSAGAAIKNCIAECVRPVRPFAIACAASIAATFVNPYGWHLHQHVIAYLQNTYLMDHISEFRSFSFHAPGAIYVELFLAVAVLGTLALFRQQAYGPAMLGVALLHMSLYSARHLPTAAVLLLPLSVAALTREASGWLALRPLLRYSDRVRAIDDKVFGVIPVALALMIAVAALIPMSRADLVGFDPARFPVRAADFLEQRGLDRHVFAKDQWGGYLIYRFNGRLKVFLDGRSDLYGNEMLETYATTMDVKPGWDAVLDRFQVQSVLVPPDHALSSVLAISPHWKRVYADSVATVFERIA